MRTRTPDRLEKIAEAALAAFTARGFKQTQMSDAARLAGVSAGTLYLYAENKEALFELALRRALDLMPDDAALPLRSAGRDATLKLLGAAVRRRRSWPLLTAGLARRPPRDVAEEVAGIVGEFFDALSAEWRLISLLDANAWDLPALAQAFGGLRRAYFGDISAYVTRRRKEKRLAFAGDTAAMTRGVVEAVIWLAMDRRRDPAPTGVDDAAARAAAIEVAVSGWKAGD